MGRVREGETDWSRRLRKEMNLKARELRNSLTETEKYLWYMLRLRNLGFKFRRQAVIGQYIVDFVCYEKKLIIEVDGGQHLDNKYDKERDQWLRGQGFKVLRFWNNDVLENRDGVIQKIVENLNAPLPSPPHKGEGIDRRSPPHKGEGKEETLKNSLPLVGRVREGGIKIVSFFLCIALISFFATTAMAAEKSNSLDENKPPRAQSPQWFSAEVKTGFWMPSNSAVHHFFGDCCNLVTKIQGGLLVKGRYGVEGGVGFFFKDGDAVGIADGVQSRDSFSFFLLPMETNFVWRADYWKWDYLVPYTKFGFDYVFFRENLKGDITKGMKYGFHFVGGLQINLSKIGGDSMLDMEEETGINELFLTLEVEYQFIDNFGSKGLNLSGPIYSLGFLFEF